MMSCCSRGWGGSSQTITSGDSGSRGVSIGAGDAGGTGGLGGEVMANVRLPGIERWGHGVKPEASLE